MKRWTIRILKFLRATFIALFTLVFLLQWLISLPAVQKKILPYTENILSSALHTKVKVREISLDFPMRVSFKDIYIYDKQNQEFISAQSGWVNAIAIDYWNLIFGKETEAKVGLGNISLNKANVHLYKRRKDGKLNTDFLSEGGDTTKASKKIDLDFPNIHLYKSSFSYVDSTAADSVLNQGDYFNFKNMTLSDINGNLGFRMLPEKVMILSPKKLSFTEKKSGFALKDFSGNIVYGRGYQGDERPTLYATNIQFKTATTELSFDAGMIPASVLDTIGGMPGYKVAVQMHHTTINFDLLSYFLPKAFPLTGSIQLEGLIVGSERELYSDSVIFTTGKQTHLMAAMAVRNYMSPTNISWEADFRKGSKLSFTELDSIMTGSNLPVRETVMLEGRVSGDIDSIMTKNLKLWYGRDTHLELYGSISDFRNEDKMFMDLKYSNSSINMIELKQLLPLLQKQLQNNFDKVGKVYVQGRYKGKLKDFTVNSDLQTIKGTATANIHLMMPGAAADIRYEGELSTQHLDVNLLGISRVIKSRDLNFEGTVKGRGLKFETSEIEISGGIKNSDFFWQDIQSLQAEKIVSDSGKVTGSVVLTDPEGNASLFVDLDAISSPKKVVVKGDMDSLNLKHYLPGVFKYEIKLTTIVNVNIQGDSLENLTGRARLDNAVLLRSADLKVMEINKILLKSEENTVNFKNIVLQSPLVNVTMAGAFSFREGGKLVARLAKEAKIYFANEDSVTKDYYANKVIEKDTLSLTYELSAGRQLSQFLEFNRLEYRVADSSSLKGKLVSSRTDNFVMDIHSDSIRVNSISIYGIEGNLQLTKDAKENSLLATAGIKSKNLVLSAGVSFQDVLIEPTALDNSIEFWISGRQDALGNKFRINGETVLLQSGIVTRINPNVSVIYLKDIQWRVSQRNQVVYADKKIKVKDLRLTTGVDEISAEGTIAANLTDTLTVELNHVSIPGVMRIVDSDVEFGGEIKSMQAKLTGLMMGETRMTFHGKVDQFKYNAIDSVNINFFGYFEKRPASNYLLVQTDWFYRHERALQFGGIYDMYRKKLNFLSDSSDIPLKWVQPFAESIVSNLKGNAKIQKFSITGSPEHPNLDGKITLNNASAKIIYLGTNYSFANGTEILFNNDSIIIPGANLQDVNGVSAYMKGDVTFPGNEAEAKDSLSPVEAEPPHLNLRVDFNRGFEVLNTTKKENEMFYGHAFANEGYARIHGTLKEIEITSEYSPSRNTWIDIPVSDYTNATRLEYVVFTKVGKAEDSIKAALTGFKLHFLVKMNPEAKIRLIFDEKVGDLIEVYGDGNIRLDITNEGEFEMRGQYRVTKGNYLFTSTYGVNKKFTVKDGSTIIWSGLAYDADLNIDAVYPVNANLSDLLGSSVSGKVEVDVIMHLGGTLSAPEISLSLYLPETSQEDVAGLASYFRNIQYDEQELNKQVVSLLIFHRFAPRSTGADEKGGGSGGITSSISELISNQVNYWLSQAVNANIGVTVGTDQFENVDVGVKASLFDNRVTIERNGNIIGNKTGQVSIGDVSVLIKLLPAQGKSDDAPKVTDPRQGQLVMEIFNRENAGLNNSYNNTTGSGIFYKKDFDRLVELFGKKEKSEIK